MSPSGSGSALGTYPPPPLAVCAPSLGSLFSRLRRPPLHGPSAEILRPGPRSHIPTMRAHQPAFPSRGREDLQFGFTQNSPRELLPFSAQGQLEWSRGTHYRKCCLVGK